MSLLTGKFVQRSNCLHHQQNCSLTQNIVEPGSLAIFSTFSCWKEVPYLVCTVAGTEKGTAGKIHLFAHHDKWLFCQDQWKYLQFVNLSVFLTFTISSINSTSECFDFFSSPEKTGTFAPFMHQVNFWLLFLLSFADKVVGWDAKFYTFCHRKQRTGNALHFPRHYGTYLFISIYLLLSVAEKRFAQIPNSTSYAARTKGQVILLRLSRFYGRMRFYVFFSIFRCWKRDLCRWCLLCLLPQEQENRWLCFIFSHSLLNLDWLLLFLLSDAENENCTYVKLHVLCFRKKRTGNIPDSVVERGSYILHTYFHAFFVFSHRN